MKKTILEVIHESVEGLYDARLVDDDDNEGFC